MNDKNEDEDKVKNILKEEKTAISYASEVPGVMGDLKTPISSITRYPNRLASDLDIEILKRRIEDLENKVNQLINDNSILMFELHKLKVEIEKGK